MQRKAVSRMQAAGGQEPSANIEYVPSVTHSINVIDLKCCYLFQFQILILMQGSSSHKLLIITFLFAHMKSRQISTQPITLHIISKITTMRTHSHPKVD